MRTLKAGQHQLVFTQGVNVQIAVHSKFAQFVYTSLLQFNRGDWGDVSPEDWKANDEALESLNTGGWYGRILASYTLVIHDYERIEWTVWIIRNTAEQDSTQAITVLFPGEY